MRPIFLCLLGHGRLQHAAVHGLETRHVTVEADHHHRLPQIGDFHCLRGTQRHGVGAAEEHGDVRVTLQQVLGDREAFVLRPLGRLFGDDFQVGEAFQAFLETFGAVVFRRGAQLPLKDGDAAFAARYLADVFGKRARTGNAVAGNKRIAGCVRRVAVHGNHRNPRRLGGFDPAVAPAGM